MVYSSPCNRHRFKRYYCYVLFLSSKSPSDIMKNIFNFISICSWKKLSLLTNIRNKCVARNINLYFLTSWKMAFFQMFVIFNMIRDSFLMGNIRTWKKVRLQKLIKFILSGKYSFWYFSSCLQMKDHLGRVFPSHFLQNVLTETSNIFLKNF